jgi:tetratricopeptide (TPR) repeat protein
MITKKIESNPSETHDYYKDGKALLIVGKNEEAIQVYDQAITINPNYAAAYNFKGIALVNLGKYEEAIQAYNKAIKLDPNYADAYSYKGIALSKLGDNEAAAQASDIAIKLNPNDDAAYNNKGYALYKMGKKEEAVQSFDTAIKLNSKCAYAYYNKGNALSDLGRKEEAAQTYELATKINNEFDSYMNGLVNCLDVLKSESHKEKIPLNTKNSSPQRYDAKLNIVTEEQSKVSSSFDFSSMLALLTEINKRISFLEIRLQTIDWKTDAILETTSQKNMQVETREKEREESKHEINVLETEEGLSKDDKEL